MKRRYLCIGDKSETGGSIAPAVGPSYTVYGHQVATIGAEVRCETCANVGRIVKAGGPNRPFHCGNEIALDGDILLCACLTPPRMVATMQDKSWHEDLGDMRGQQAEAKDIAPSPIAMPFDEQVEGIGPGVDAGYPFFVETFDGRKFSGRLNNQGQLPRIYSASELDYAIYWGDEALTRTEATQCQIK